MVLFGVGKFKSYVSCSGFLHSKDILIVVYPILIHTYPAVSPKNRDCTFIKKVCKPMIFATSMYLGRIFK